MRYEPSIIKSGDVYLWVGTVPRELAYERRDGAIRPRHWPTKEQAAEAGRALGVEERKS